MIAPDGNRWRWRASITTRRRSGSRRSTFDDGTIGYATDGTPVDCVRFAELRPGRGLRARADRLRHQPRLQPRRRRHLLGHGRRGARGDRPRHPGDRRLPAVDRPRDGLPLRRAASASTSRPTFTARIVAELDDVPLPRGTLLNINVPGDEPHGVEVTRLGKRIYNDELKLARGRRRGPPALPDLRRRPGLRTRSRGPTSRRSPAGTIAVTPSTSTSPTTTASTRSRRTT